MLNPETAFRDCRKAGAGWLAKCPAHDDHRSSLSIGLGDGGKWLLKCHAGCALDDILAAAHLELADLFPETNATAKRTIIAAYDYTDESGSLLYQVCRLSPKDFQQRRPDGAGGWIWKLGDVRRVLYGLPKLREEKIVFIVEGEKDANRLVSLGLAATTNSGGAGKWRREYAEQLQAAAVAHAVIVPDHDEAGRKHADDVARSLHAAGLKVKVIALPGLGPKGDISNWLDTGHTKAELMTLVKGTALYAPAVLPVPVSQGSRAPVLVTLADVEPRPITWLWPGRIACGKLTLIVGDPGLGKSWLTHDIAARVSTGGAWPDVDHAPRGDVILLTAEDALDDTIRPRLDALGADVGHIHALTAIRDDELRAPVLARDLDILERVVIERRARFVCIDPLSAYLGETDSHRDAEVRGVLAPLAALAERTGVAIVGVMHLGKGTQRPALYRAIGSIAFVAAARLVLAVATHPDDHTRRVLAPVKSNICMPAATLAYRLDAGRLVWDGAPVVGIDAEALLGQSTEDRETQTDAERVIAELLEDTEAWPMDARQATEAGRAHGISDRTMQRTARRLGIRIARVGFGRGGRWVWQRPGIPDTPIDDTRSIDADVASMSSMASMRDQAEELRSIDDRRSIDDTKSVLTSMSSPRSDPWAAFPRPPGSEAAAAAVAARLAAGETRRGRR